MTNLKLEFSARILRNIVVNALQAKESVKVTVNMKYHLNVKSQKFQSAYKDVLVLASRLFSVLPKVPQKMMLTSKVVKIDFKIIIAICQSKFVPQSEIIGVHDGHESGPLLTTIRETEESKSEIF